MIKEKPNILIVCGRNKRRSRTAEHIFKKDQRFHIRSVGLSTQSERKISESDLHWADLVLVMEQAQKMRIRENYRSLQLPGIEVLDIPDEYDFMNEELVTLLSERVNMTLKTLYEI